MKMLFDFLPILIFFTAYMLKDIYFATWVAIGTAILQVGGYWLKFRRFETMQVISLVMIIIFGGATLVLHDPIFIKWKFSVVYWLTGLFFLSTLFIGEKTLVQRVMDNQISLPEPVWRNLNLSWVVYFIVLGFVNIAIAFRLSTEHWMYFKLGVIGISFLFVLGQSFYIARFIDENDDKKPSDHNNEAGHDDAHQRPH